MIVIYAKHMPALVPHWPMLKGACLTSSRRPDICSARRRHASASSSLVRHTCGISFIQRRTEAELIDIIPTNSHASCIVKLIEPVCRQWRRPASMPNPNRRIAFAAVDSPGLWCPVEQLAPSASIFVAWSIEAAWLTPWRHDLGDTPPTCEAVDQRTLMLDRTPRA